MIKNILITLLLANSLVFGALPTSVKIEKTFTDKDLLSMFLKMMTQVSKHYYYRDKIDFKKINNRLDVIQKDGSTLDKKTMYKLVNLSLDGESGFYTKEEFLKKFAFLINTHSTYEIKKYDDISYLNLQHFTYEDLGKLKEYLQINKPKKFILDLRNNFYTPSSNISALANFFVSDGIIYSKRYLTYKGKYTSSILDATKEGTIANKAEIVILINEKTASSAEAMAHSLKFAKNIQLIGQDSAGKSNSFFIERFNGSDFFVLTDGEYFYQKYRVLNNIGVNPTIRVIEDNEGIDKSLINAIKYLKEKK